MVAGSEDEPTLRFYTDNAEAYAAAGERPPSPALDAFLDSLPPDARILELGCGGGRDAAHMLARGFDVTPTDGTPALAELAERRLGRPVLVLRFDDLEADAAYDAVWADACLLHARADQLTGVLTRVRRALRPGGRFAASYKEGETEGRDRFGRYFNFPTRAGLEAAYAAAGPWARLRVRSSEGGGYDGVTRVWLQVEAVRP